jgi:multisubunit Na+/H+ antiporter MnhE subunit
MLEVFALRRAAITAFLITLVFIIWCIGWMIKNNKLTFTKIIVSFILGNSAMWVWCSYYLAWCGREQIADSLSKTVIAELIGVVLTYSLKEGVANMAKYNSWPEKQKKDKHNDTL